MAIVNMAALTAVLKYLISDIKSAVNSESKFLSLIPRFNSFGGMGRHFPIYYAGMRTGANFSDAINNRGTPGMDRFYIPTLQALYTLGSIDNYTLQATVGDTKALKTALLSTTQAAIDGWNRRQAVHVWGTGSGTLAQTHLTTSGFASQNLVLRYPQQAINFEPGMNIMVAPDDGTNPLRAGGPVTLTGVNAATGTLTVAANWNATFPAMANGDFLVAGSASGSDYNASLHGVQGWIPPAAARPLVAPWFAVTRSAAEHLLGGSAFTATGGSIGEVVVEAAAQGAGYGGKYDACFVHPTQMANVRKEYQAKGWSEVTTKSLSTPEIGFKSIAFIGGDGESIALLEEKFMRPDMALLTKLDSWELQTTGKLPDFVDNGSGSKFWPSPSDDAADFRLYGFHELVCKEPKNSVLIAL
jgi:hypothetical protein